MSSLLNIGSRALTAAQGSLATVSHNIANANTAGYSRQQAQLATAGGQYTGSGFFGNGVDLTGVRRQYDQFLTGAVQSAASTSAADATRASGLQALDTVFGNSDQGIGSSIDDFFGAAGDLANRPSDLSARQVFVARASQLAQRITSVGSQIAALSNEADSRLASDATQANGKIAEIAKLNASIALGLAQGQSPNDLLDQRDAAVQALGGFLQVNSVAQDDGTVNLFTADGSPLLVGQQQAKLASVTDPDNAAQHAIQLRLGTTTKYMDGAALGGGSLAGAMRLRDEDYPAALNQVGRIAQVLAGAVNAQQAAGVDMDGKAGAALFTVPGPATLTASTNTGSGALGATVADASALQASDYQVSWDGSAYQVKRMSDGQVQGFSSLPATLDGLQFTASGTPAAGDHWEVRPFAAAATGIAANTLTARQVATGMAATVQAAATNTGGATASDFAITRASSDNTLPVTITFNNPPTSFNVTGLAGGNLANVPYTPGQQVPAAPADYNGWSITLKGTPAAGDAFNVAPTTNPGADNRNALALSGLAQAGLAAGATLNESYAALVGDVGSRVQAGQAEADVSQKLQSDAVSRQQNLAGVNLDEEAADMLRFQQAYQASARIIQTSQTLFEALLSATTR